MKYIKIIFKILILFIITVLCDFLAGTLYKNLTQPPEMFYKDPKIGLRHIANINKTSDWPEAKNGQVIFRTNNLGFREDEDTPVLKKDGAVRYMVFGDSHTDGVVNNAFSFSNLAEEELTRRTGKTYEIINAASGHTSLYQQSLHLEEWLHLRPDKVIFVFYTGNDYLEIQWTFIPHSGLDEKNQLIALSAENAPFDWTARSVILRVIRRFDNSVKMKAERINRYAVWQSLSQANYFKENPGSFERSSQLHGATLKKIKRLAGEHRFSLLVFVLPTKYQIEPETDSLSFPRLEELYGLSSEDKADDRVRLDFKGLLEKNEIDIIDFYDSLKTAARNHPDRPLFWNSDHHLSERGHEEIARIWTKLEMMALKNNRLQE